MFSQAILLLVITVHNIPTVVQCTQATAPGRFTLTRYIMHIAWYGIIPTLRRYSQTFMLKSSTAQCAVRCGLNVIATREESSEAMAEWEMFDAVLCDACNLSSANIGRSQHLMQTFVHRYVSKADLINKDLSRASNRRRRKQIFLLHFGRRSTSTGQISAKHRFVQPHNQSQSFRKNQTFIPLRSR